MTNGRRTPSPRDECKRRQHRPCNAEEVLHNNAIEFSADTVKSATEVMNKGYWTGNLARMVEDAKNLGADAVINVRMTTSVVMQGACEILAYGTAVKISD